MMTDMELKAYKNLECAFNTSSQQDIVVAEDSEGGGIVFEEGDEIYLKSEADKVIAELKRACNSKDDWCLHTLKENRHHKYKRCLAMAEWCNSEMGRETFACFRTRNTKEVWREEHKYWAKWRKIWFELYKKLKPNKNTATAPATATAENKI